MRNPKQAYQPETKFPEYEDSLEFLRWARFALKELPNLPSGMLRDTLEKDVSLQLSLPKFRPLSEVNLELEQASKALSKFQQACEDLKEDCDALNDVITEQRNEIESFRRRDTKLRIWWLLAGVAIGIASLLMLLNNWSLPKT